MRTLHSLLIALLVLVPAARAQVKPVSADTGWVLLFNGKDLSGWETWLNRASGQQSPLGLNNDPLKVFTVVDGAIRISGEVFGALTTLNEYENFHLVLEQRWGEKKWPPRLDRPRDSGLCYHATGAHGVFAGSWMKSYQLQIGEGNTGEHWSIAGPIADVEAGLVDGKLNYRQGAPVVTHSTRGGIVPEGVVERPVGEWNTIELIARGDSATYIVNGRIVMKLSRLRDAVDGQPLTRGRLQLQTEGAEVWYRNIRIRRLPSPGA